MCVAKEHGFYCWQQILWNIPERLFYPSLEFSFTLVLEVVLVSRHLGFTVKGDLLHEFLKQVIGCQNCDVLRVGSKDSKSIVKHLFNILFAFFQVAHLFAFA